jgi:hypothetical protein
MAYGDGVPVSPKILFEIHQQQNQSLPEVKVLSSERLKKCRSRIDQAVRDGCLEQYLADFESIRNPEIVNYRGSGYHFWWKALCNLFMMVESNILIEPSGSGKTMRASHLPTILSFISFDEAIETTKIQSIADGDNALEMHSQAELKP